MRLSSKKLPAEKGQGYSQKQSSPSGSEHVDVSDNVSYEHTEKSQPDMVPNSGSSTQRSTKRKATAQENLTIDSKNSISADGRRRLDKHAGKGQDSIKYPISGSTAKKLHAKDKLSLFEQTEVEEFEEVYYLAPNNEKYQPTKLERLVNNGFDDQEGYYRIVNGD